MFWVLDCGDTDVIESGLYECYAAHPPGDSFHSTSLAHFAIIMVLYIKGTFYLWYVI